VLAPDIVHILLGSAWDLAVPLLQIFSIYALLRSVGNPVGSLLLAKGRADLSFKWNIALLCVVPPFIWVGSWYGVTGMSLTMTLLMVLLYIPAWYYLILPLCGARLGEYFVQSGVPLANALLSGGVTYWIFQDMEVGVMRLVGGLLVGLLSYLFLSWKFNREWFSLMWEVIQPRLAK
ncbi:MAG: polysaccharide biosynthesis C-terminal domain-containing protein, partial [Mariprofundaceae bacterium]